MINPMKILMVAAISCVTSTSALAQVDINISGKVVDATGKGLAGVTVTLKKNKSTTLTGPDGTYRLDGTSSLVRSLDGKGPAGLMLRSRMLEFRVDETEADVRIDLHDLAGHSLATLVDGRLPRGNHRVDPFAAATRSQMVLLTVRIGQDSYVLKVFQAADRSVHSTAVSHARIHSAQALRKAAAAIVDTLLVSKDGYSPDRKRLETYSGTYDFFLAKPDEFWGIPANYPVAKNVVTYVFLNRTNGKYRDDQIYWSFAGLTKTIAEQPTLDVGTSNSGRVNFHLESATGKYWDFMEHTIDAFGWHGNTTRVDAYGLPMAMRIICSDGKDELLGEKYEVFYMGRDAFFAKYKATVPVEFQHTLDNGAPYRILAPGKGDGGFGPGEKYGTYFDAYFKELGLTGADAVTRKAFACEGAHFGENAQLCGAVNRHVAHLPKSEWTNTANFYKQAPANYYAKFFHDWSFQEKAYGFAYDDAENMAAYTECRGPKYVIIAVGF